MSIKRNLRRLGGAAVVLAAFATLTMASPADAKLIKLSEPSATQPVPLG